MIPSQNNRKHSRTAVAVLMLGLALGAASLTQGVPPDKATKTKMIKMIETAKTPADYKAIANHYKAEAALAAAKAAEHEEMAAAYKTSGFGLSPNRPTPRERLSTAPTWQRVTRLCKRLDRTGQGA